MDPGLFNDTIHIKRWQEAGILYQGEVRETTIDRDPASLSYIQFTLDSAQTGTLYISGTTAETLSYANEEFQESTYQYSSLVGMTPTNLTGYVKIQAISKGGEPIRSLLPVRDIWGNMQPIDNRQYFRLAGMDDDFRGSLKVNFDEDIQNGDIISVNREVEQFEVKQSTLKNVLGQPHHIEIILKSYKKNP